MKHINIVRDRVQKDIERLGIEALGVWGPGTGEGGNLALMKIRIVFPYPNSWGYMLTSYLPLSNQWHTYNEGYSKNVLYSDWRVAVIVKLKEDPPPDVNILRLEALKVKLQEDIERFPI